MSHDAPPVKQHDPKSRTEPTLSPGRVRDINAKLPLGFHCAVNHSPVKGQRPRVIVLKEPRSNTGGKPPRRGVHIPQPMMAQARLAKIGKHSRQKARFKGGWDRPAKIGAQPKEAL